MAVMSIDPAAHAHTWSLQGVTYEDSLVLEELVCSICGAVTYR